MQIDRPETLPFVPEHTEIEPNTITAMEDACLAIMERFAIRAAHGVNSPNPFDWDNSFFGPVPLLEDLVRVAEENGFDVRHGIEDFGDGEWSASFRSIRARDPEAVQSFRRDLATGKYFEGSNYSSVPTAMTA